MPHWLPCSRSRRRSRRRIAADRELTIAYDLHPHPQSACAALRGVQVTLTRASGRWGLSYRLVGRIDALLVPSPAPPARRDGLWQHLCCELFVMAADGRYCEFNFSPSGEWAGYRFDSYRGGAQPMELATAPDIEVRRGSGDLHIDVSVALPPAPGVPARIGVCVVIEEAGGRLSYWAVKHPAARADFHDAAGFVPLPRN